MKDKKSYHLTPSIDRLTLRLILPEEQERFNDLLIQHHYLHSAGERGRDPALCGFDRRAMGVSFAVGSG